ncbi:MAG TPA: alpha-amylase family glycosyl hydrolase, partial [Chitinophagales bacterium]|nr:alpha-amylase family glycosyl hydrolase [Chitinophagales bacterium]
MYKKIHLISLFVLFGMFVTNCSSTKNISSNAKTTFANASMYEVNIRQFSPEGTFKQVEEQLPRLKSMGVGIVWLMPIHPIGEFNRKGALGSYYSIKDYNAVNPEFGTMDDFKRLVKKCHDLGMFIIIDWVANHSSCDNVWLKTHSDWYTKDKAGNFQPPVADWSDVYDLNYDNPDLQAAMVEAMKFWVTEADIDGFRCDVAEMVPDSFWKKARLALNTLNKPIFMLAEGEKPELHANGFDATYDWTLHHLINDVAQNKKTVVDLDSYFKTTATKYGKNDYRLQFTSNHDENSWNGTEYERLGSGVKSFAILTATIPGMPLVYSGQESALKKRLKFFEKDLPLDLREIVLL